MQVKFKDFSIKDSKITGIICNDIYYLNKLNEMLYLANKNVKNKNIGLISIKDAYNDIDESLEEFITSNCTKNTSKIDDILKMLGIGKSMLNTNMSTLSISERILVLFAKTLLTDPDTILVDNVLSKLDSRLRDKIIKILIKLNKFNNKTIVISSIDVDIIYEYIDDIVIIKNDRCLACLEKHAAYNQLDGKIIQKPLVVDITQKVYNKSKIKLGNNDSINELIKAIYREIR